MPEYTNFLTQPHLMTLRRLVIESAPVELAPFTVDAAMATMAGIIERQVNELLQSALDNRVLPTEFKIDWRNQPNATDNPFGNIGLFRTELQGYKPQE